MIRTTQKIGQFSTTKSSDTSSPTHLALSTQMTARFIRAVVVSRVFLLPCHGRNRVFHTHSSAVLGSSLHTLTLPAAWRQVSSISIHLAHSRVHAARDLHDLSSIRASVSVCLDGRGQGCAAPTYRPTLHTLNLPAAWRQVSTTDSSGSVSLAI